MGTMSGPVWALSTASSNRFRWFFFQAMDNVLTGPYRAGLCGIPEGDSAHFSSPSVTLSPLQVLPCEPQLPPSPRTLSSIFSTQGACWPLPGSPFLSQPADSAGAIVWLTLLPFPRKGWSFTARCAIAQKVSFHVLYIVFWLLQAEGWIQSLLHCAGWNSSPYCTLTRLYDNLQY